MPKKYKIALDISPLNDGNSIRGVGVYTQHLLQALQEEVAVNPMYRHFSIHLIESSKSKKDSFDLIHYPYFDPFYLTLPPKQNIPQIITIHDLIPRQFKNHFPAGIRGEIKWLIQSYRARFSNYIVTVSQYSKNVISEILRYPADKIYVTYEAGDKTYHTSYTPTQVQKIKEKYQLPDRFVLNNGDINWNKNIPNLVKTCFNLNIPLVLVGSASTKKVEPHPWNEDILWTQNQTNPLLIRLGYVPDEDLPVIYHLASIYCQPSYAEGFGLSLVKAMQTGTPVVYSQETSLPEVMGDCGISFDPYSPNGLEKSLSLLWNDKKLAQMQSKLGLKRCQHFSWKQTAIQTLAVYDLAIKK